MTIGQPKLPTTLYEKIWWSHVVKEKGGRQALLYIDRHLVQEVSSPQAFVGLEERGVALHRPDAHIAVADHAVSTDKSQPNPKESLAYLQVQRLIENTKKHAMPYIAEDDPRQGIVHIIGPEQGFTLPGATLVCGDSHTSTHGAFGALAFGIGASQCETVFATQCLHQTRQKTMRITLSGAMGQGVTTKDIILALIAKIGTAGGKGYAIEFTGGLISGLSMEARMTLCNMAIEAGARIGLIAPDDTTFAYLKGRPLAPQRALWDQAVESWRQLRTDDDAIFDQELEFDVSQVSPYVSWGTTPAESCPITDHVPNPQEEVDLEKRKKIAASLTYIGLKPGTALEDIKIDRVFIGSCTNSRIEDLRASAAIAKDRHVAQNVSAMVVPGSAQVAAQAEAEGLVKIFKAAGFHWRSAGCSMCVAMNADRLAPGERCASTSNRNFEGRQGPGGRTHLMSPAMAAAAAVTGKLIDVRKLASK